MDIRQAIANKLNLSTTSITEVREWSYVYWVRLSGRRPTLVSKKGIMNTNQQYIGLILKNLAWDDCDRLCVGETVVPKQDAPWHWEDGLLVQSDNDLVSIEFLCNGDKEIPLTQTEKEEAILEWQKEVARKEAYNAFCPTPNSYHLEVWDVADDVANVMANGETAQKKVWVDNITGEAVEQKTPLAIPTLDEYLQGKAINKDGVAKANYWRQVWVEQNLDALVALAKEDGLI